MKVTMKEAEDEEWEINCSKMRLFVNIKLENVLRYKFKHENYKMIQL